MSKHFFFCKVILLILASLGCSKKSVVEELDEVETPVKTEYKYLPEDLIAKDENKQVTARYVDPTNRYAHGILGDQIEAGGLLVTVKGKEYIYRLDENHVFEDLQPRLADVDNDGTYEYITIVSSLTKGASVAVFKIKDDKLQLHLSSDFIVTPNRWLNIAAIDDLDNDGKVEIAWIQTPHIGGILKIARVEKNQLVLLDSKSGITNHLLGSRNLCLSVLTASTPYKTLFIPTQKYDGIKGFKLVNDKIQEVENIILNVNTSKSLLEQYDFTKRISDLNCINPL